MKVGTMDAFCVGEPWNDQLVNQGIGYTACTTGEIWKDHPEKCLGMRADWVDKNPKAAQAVLQAVHGGPAVVRQAGEHRGDVPTIVGKRQWFNVPPADILDRIKGDDRLRRRPQRSNDSRPVDEVLARPRLAIPFQSHELWFLTENQRWGMLPADLDTKAIIAKVNREDIWREAAKALGVADADMPDSTSRGKETFFDGKVFDPADPEGLPRQPADQEGRVMQARQERPPYRSPPTMPVPGADRPRSWPSVRRRGRLVERAARAARTRRRPSSCRR